MHTAQCDTDVFPAYCLGDGLSEAGLSYSRRAVEAENRGFHVAPEFQDGKVLDDSLLDFFQSVMVLVQNLLGVLEVKVILGHVVPWKVQHEFHVVVLDAVVRR